MQSIDSIMTLNIRMFWFFKVINLFLGCLFTQINGVILMVVAFEVIYALLNDP